MGKIIKTAMLESQRRDAENAEKYAEEFADVRDAIARESANRLNAVNQINEDITALQDAINSESANRQNAVTDLQNALANEVTNRTNAVAAAKTDLISEIDNAKDNQRLINDDLNSKIQQLQNVHSADTGEISGKIDNLNAALANDIDNLRKDFNANTQTLTTNLNAEIANRTNAVNALDNAVNTKIATLQNDLTAEVNNRTNAVNALENAVNTKVTALQENLDAEITDRTNALDDLEAALLLSIGNLDAAQNIQNQALRQQIQNSATSQNATLKNIEDKLNDEITSRANEDIALANSIANEISNRTNALDALQSSITDAVNTKNAETLNAAKSYADDKFANVSISDFTAPTASADGKSGLVPAPPKGSDLKILTTQGWRTMDSAELTITSLPTQANSLTYNKNSQSPSWKNFDAQKLTISGNTSATSAGTYSVTFTPAGLYVWSDSKDQAPKTQYWTIQKLKLTKPTAAVTSFNFDGATKTLQVQNYDSNYITQSGEVSANAVGNYSACFTLKNSSNTTWSDGTTAKVTINWSIANKSLTAEQSAGFVQVGSLTYSGGSLSPTIQHYDPDVHTLSGDTSKIDAGSYTIKIAPKTGLTWSDGTNAVKSVTWTIQKRSVPIPYASITNFTYDGNSKTLQVTNYDAAFMTQAGTTSESKTGDFSVTYKLKNANLIWEDETTADVVIEWSIGSMSFTKPTLSFTSKTYNAETFAPAIKNFDANYMTKSGTESAENVGTYTITIKLKDGYTWKDGSTNAVSLTWNITVKTVARPSLEVDEFTYNGNSQAPVFKNYDETLQWYTVTGTQSSKSAGTYSLTFKLKNANVQWTTGDDKSEDVVLTWKINKKTVKKPTLAQSSYEYSGEEIHAVFNDYDENSDEVSKSSGSLSGTNAGTYTVYFKLKSTANMQWDDGTTANAKLTWTITKRAIVRPTLLKSEYTYNKASINALLTNYDANSTFYSVSGTTKATYPGEYQFTIALTDAVNTQWDNNTTGDLTLDWKINAIRLSADYDNLTQDIEIVYNGEIRNWYEGFSIDRKVLGNAGQNNYSTVYSRNAGNFSVRLNPGTGYVWADGTTDYRDVTWTILPMKVEMPTWSNTNFVYDGTAKGPNITRDESNTIIEGTYSATGANSMYTFTIKLKSAYNMRWTDGTTDDFAGNWKIERQPVETPTLESNYFAWDGTTHAVTMSGYDSSIMTWSGTTNAVDVGTYEVVFTLEDVLNYKWRDADDESYDPNITVQWQIGSAELPIPTLEYQDPYLVGHWLYWNVKFKNFNSNLIDYEIADREKWGNAQVNQYLGSIRVDIANAVDADDIFLGRHVFMINNGYIKFSLKDKQKYKWANGKTDDTKVKVNLPAYKIDSVIENMEQDIEVVYDGKAREWYEFFSAAHTYYSSTGLLENRCACMFESVETKYTNAGTYKVKLTPSECCTWQDGTYGVKEFEIKVKKATPTLYVTDEAGKTYTIKDEIYSFTDIFYPKSLTSIYKVSTDSDGKISAKASSPYAASIFNSADYFSIEVDETAGKVSVTAIKAWKGYGDSYLVTGLTYFGIYVKEGENYEQSKIFKRDFLSFLTLEDMTWKLISQCAKAGTLGDKVDVGETKSLTLAGSYGEGASKVDFGTGTTVQALLLGINHNEAVEGTNRAHFAILRSVRPNGSGWAWGVISTSTWSKKAESGTPPFTFYHDYNDFYELIEGGPKEYIREAKKYVGTTYAVKKTWLMSAYEVRGEKLKKIDELADYEENLSYQAQYEYFANGNGSILPIHKARDGETATSHTVFSTWSRSTDGKKYLMGKFGIPSADPMTYYGIIPCFAI